MSTGDHLVEIVQRAEDRINVAVIRHVIAHVTLRRLEDWRQPDAVDTKGGNVRQAAGDPLQVAHAIAGGIHEGAWIDLIDDRVAPPFPHVDYSLSVRFGETYSSGSNIFKTI